MSVDEVAPAGQSADFAKQLRLLREGYARQLPDKLAQLEQAFAQHQAEGGLRQLRHHVHGLAGSGATFGFPVLSETARRLEGLISEAVDAEQALGPALCEEVHRLLGEMREAARLPAVCQPPPTLAQGIGVSRKLVYLVEDDAAQATELALQLGRFGYRVNTFATPDHLVTAVSNPALAAILMDIVFPQGDLAGAQAIMELSAAQHLKAPVIFISVRGDLASRLAAERAGAAAYMTKPLDVRSLISVLDDLTSDRPPEPYRVLIVDDTELLARHYAFALQSAGMLTEVVTDPLRILAHLSNFKPDLLLLDMYMPGCTGAELARVVRQMESHVLMPIVFLSAESDASKQMTALRLGGDDFLTKPITPERLVAAVTARLRRYRVLRSYMERDSLTGLLNHGATKEYLNLETARAARHGQSFCFAILDLDHFKAVNDNYGHPVGDRVLKSLAALLKSRLRKTDLIGRLGGEEFGVLLPHTRGEAAVALLDELRDAFSGVHQHAEDGGEFRLSLSCGVAEYRLGQSSERIYVVADQALYLAKQAGRNRVVLAADPLLD